MRATVHCPQRVQPERLFLSFLTSMTHPEGGFSHRMTQGAERNSHGMTHP